MFAAFLDKLSTQDFWRGLIYVGTAAGITISPPLAATITTVGLGVSGLLHVFFPSKPSA